jgi:Xaa-Pro aminopeptidase
MTMTAEAGTARKPVQASALPFDAAKLDRLLDQEGIDAVVICSKANIQYLLGGYRFFFFDHFDAVGPSRYLPLLIYQKGRLDHAAYFGNPMEGYERDNGRFWITNLELQTRGSTDATKLAVDHLKSLGKLKRVGIERSFLPADAEATLKAGLPGVEIVEAWSPLERLRAVKTPKELELIREASERVIDSMLAVMTGHGPGSTKNELVQALKEEEVKRGLTFEYCLITAGTSLNRAPSDQVWGEGDILSLDSGGNYGGYIGDMCRMAIQGEPDSELKDMLAEVDAIQMASRKPIRAGATGTELYESAGSVLRKSPHANSIEFVAHGMGLVTHEAPRLTYTRQDMDAPLEAGMILSIETTLHHPKRGFIKLEDTIAVTKNGWEAYGDRGRGWNRGRAN